MPSYRTLMPALPTSAPKGEDDAVLLADALRPLILKLSRRLRQQALKADLSPLDAQILGLVGRTPGIGVSQLAAIEQVTNASMSANIKKLIAAGWLEGGRADGGDQRRICLTLTDKATQSIERIRQIRNDWLLAQIIQLNDADRAALASALGPLGQLI